MKWRKRGRCGPEKEYPLKGGSWWGGDEGSLWGGRIGTLGGREGDGLEPWGPGRASGGGDVLLTVLLLFAALFVLWEEGGGGGEQVGTPLQDAGGLPASPRKSLARCWRWTAAQARKVRSMHLLKRSCTAALSLPAAE